MRKSRILLAVEELVELTTAFAPVEASASCQGRKDTGMVLGGIGGALVGNSISRGGTGAVVGGLGGAVLGHQIAKSGCAPARRVVYRTRTAPSNAYAERAQAPRRVYYDQYGTPVPVQPVPYGAPPAALASR